MVLMLATAACLMTAAADACELLHTQLLSDNSLPNTCHVRAKLVHMKRGCSRSNVCVGVKRKCHTYGETGHQRPTTRPTTVHG